MVLAGFERLLSLLERDPTELELDPVALDAALREAEQEASA